LARQTYEQKLPELKKKYNGKYVAIRGNNVLDIDPDPSELRKRCQRQGKEVLTFYVGDEIELALREDYVAPITIHPERPLTLLEPDEHNFE